MITRRVFVLLTCSALVLGAGFYILRAGIGNLVGSGQAFAEKTAVSTLRRLHWGQGIFRTAGWIDEDGNGVGEFGSMEQMAALEKVPSGKILSTPLTPPSGTRVQGGILEAGGYCFRFDLPEGAHARERRFVAWAWPMTQGAGNRMYCLDQDEQIFEKEAGETLGCEAGPPRLACPPDESFVRWQNKTNKRPVGVQ